MKKSESPVAYFVGGGIASLAGAAFLIRDANFPGKNIHIFEEENVYVGGCLDGSGSPDSGYISRGGRMFEEKYVCSYDLFSSIPSIENPKSTTIKEEIFNFNREVISNAKCRLLVDMNAMDVSSYGLSFRHLTEMLLLIISNNKINKTIEEWFAPSFFQTVFWLLWTTSFSFQPWDNVDELKRYFLRFMHLLPGFDKYLGILRTRFNQYDSLILPIKIWLQNQGVDFKMNAQVEDIKFDIEDGTKSVTQIRFNKGKDIEVKSGDYVFVTLGSMVENSTRGSMKSAPTAPSAVPGGTWALWNKIARYSPDFGNPEMFINNPEIQDRTKWVSFTVTQTTRDFFKFMEEFTGNQSGTGGLVSFPQSGWFMSIVMVHQPFFKNQPDNRYIFWGYCLKPDAFGDFIKKPMCECTGKEILNELFHQMKFDEKTISSYISHSNCMSTLMPYITSQFNTRNPGDRPTVLPSGATNFAFLGQYVDIPEDVVFTVEYSIRSAMMAVYSLLKVDKQVPPVFQGQQHIGVVLAAIKALLR